MEGVSASISRKARSLIDSGLQKTCTAFWAPRSVLDSSGNGNVQLTELCPEKEIYKVAKVRNGHIFTDRSMNISVFTKQGLVPEVSWQYDCGENLAAKDNFLVTGRLRITKPPHHIPKTVASLLSGQPGNYNYYHWLFEVLPRLALLSPLMESDREAHYLIPDDCLSFQRETLDALGIALNQRLSSRNYQHVSANWILATPHPLLRSYDAPAWITQFVRKSFLRLASGKRADQCIYISRHDSTNARRLSNEAQFAEILASKGFTIAILSKLNFTQQVDLFSRAKIVVGVHGAVLANLCFVPRGTVVYEIFADTYRPKMYEDIAQTLNLDYHGISCIAENRDIPNMFSSMSICRSDINQIVDHTLSLG